MLWIIDMSPGIYAMAGRHCNDMLLPRAMTRFTFHAWHQMSLVEAVVENRSSRVATETPQHLGIGNATVHGLVYIGGIQQYPSRREFELGELWIESDSGFAEISVALLK
jgi:hypothetical protein